MKNLALIVFLILLSLAQISAEPLPDDEHLFYMIQRGDTLESVAAQFGMTPEKLASMNDAEMVKRFRPDTKLALYPRNLILGRIFSEPGKKVLVIIADQKAFALDGAKIVHAPFLISSGRPANPSPIGKFAIKTKLRSMTMSGGLGEKFGSYNLTDVPYDMNFYSVFYLHGAKWNHHLGTKQSGGCINFSVEDAKWVYEWTDPKPVGKITYATSSNPGTTVWIIP